MTQPQDHPHRPAAIALGMPDAGDALPKVLATGRGSVAEQIIALAFAHGVPVREDADLAEALSALEVDMPIPPEAFAAMAEILAYVYRANQAYAQRGTYSF